MSEFTYDIKNGQSIYDDPASRQRYLDKKPDGSRGIEKHRTPKGAKSDPQLGYYWGFLLIQITAELKRQGFTKTLNLGKHSVEQYYTKDDAHEFLKEHCAKIGDDGQYVTLSAQDRYLCSKYLDNVIWVAEHWLGMDRDALEAKRPELVSPPDPELRK